ncbi:hypothetical protein Unana1_08142 [Umbelopsis nana]
MDIQLNIGHRSLSYLCKYVTKLDTHHQFSIKKASETPLSDKQKHFRARTMGAVEAAYDVLGLHKKSSDIDVKFLDTSLPEDRTRNIRTRRTQNRSASTSQESIYHSGNPNEIQTNCPRFWAHQLIKSLPEYPGLGRKYRQRLVTRIVQATNGSHDTMFQANRLDTNSLRQASTGLSNDQATLEWYDESPLGRRLLALVDKFKQEWSQQRTLNAEHSVELVEQNDFVAL